MENSAITVSVKMDAKLFRDFAVFDTFRIKQKWRSPVLFAAINLVFSILCFSRHPAAEQAIFIGIVLLTLGLGLPIFYYVNFIMSTNVQIQKFGLAIPRPVYTVTLSQAPDGIQIVTQNGKKARYEWGNIYGVYRRRDCVYLYVEKGLAYLLPAGDVADRSEELWGLINKQKGMRHEIPCRP